MDPLLAIKLKSSARLLNNVVIQGLENESTEEEIYTELEIAKFCEILDMIELTYEPSQALYGVFDYIFQPENFIAVQPISTKGTWVQIPTPTGFQLHFVKKTKGMPKNALKSILLRNFEGYYNTKFDNNTEYRIDLVNELKDLQTKILEGHIKELEFYLNLLEEHGYKLRLFTVRTSKRKSTYLLPLEFMLASDNILQLFDYVGKTPSVKFKQYFTRTDIDDQIFYLQSRGVAKQQAEVLCNRQGGFLSVNTEEIFNTPNNIQIVEK